MSPVEVVESCIDRIEKVNTTLNAFVTVAVDDARRAAKVAESEIKEGKYRGPLHGIAFGVKDIIDTSGIRTTYGSEIFINNVPSRDATVVSLLKQAGGIILGKTNTAEFALGVNTSNLHYGTTRNPWAPDRIPGGSSGGSAAAVAAGLCTAALGTDTGGSIRIPSAFCGAVGLKPTYGRVSAAGVFPLASSLDHVGLITSSVEDAAVLLQTLAGFDELDPNSRTEPVGDLTKELGRSIKGARIATSPDLIPGTIDPQIYAAYESCMSKIEDLGGEILESRFKTAGLIEQASNTILMAEAASQHANLLRQHAQKYGANVIDRFNAGQRITTTEYITALRESNAIRREVDFVFQNSDFLLTPSTQILAPKIGEDTVSVGDMRLDVRTSCVRFTKLANITGIPAIVLPYGYSIEGLPLSIQLMASSLQEGPLLNLALAIEKTTPEIRNREPSLL